MMDGSLYYGVERENKVICHRHEKGKTKTVSGNHLKAYHHWA